MNCDDGGLKIRFRNFPSVPSIPNQIEQRSSGYGQGEYRNNQRVADIGAG
jgi:hypothetical protein